MFDVHRARLLNEGGWQSQPLANDKGVVGRQNLKEVGGKAWPDEEERRTRLLCSGESAIQAEVFVLPRGA